MYHLYGWTPHGHKVLLKYFLFFIFWKNIVIIMKYQKYGLNENYL